MRFVWIRITLFLSIVSSVSACSFIDPLKVISKSFITSFACKSGLLHDGISIMCCILTLDRAVNQRFSTQDTPVKISGSSYVVEQKCVSVMK